MERDQLERRRYSGWYIEDYYCIITVIYGLNTGFGKFARIVIPQEQLE